MDGIPIERRFVQEAFVVISDLFSKARSFEDYVRVIKTIHDQADVQFSRALERSGKTLACKAGCSFCCHKKVDVMPLEVFRIVEHLRKSFSQLEVNAVRQRAAENSQKIKGLTLKEQLFS